MFMVLTPAIEIIRRRDDLIARPAECRHASLLFPDIGQRDAITTHAGHFVISSSCTPGFLRLLFAISRTSFGRMQFI